jgi:citrate synthase
LLKAKAKKLAKEKGEEFERELALYDMIEKLSPAIIQEVHKSDKSICANVDMYSGLVYSMLNIPRELFTPIFAISRIAGWSAHRIEEIVSGGRIYRPAYKNVSKEREYVPILERKK